MKPALLVVAALLLGIAAGEWSTRNFAFRAALGRLMGRGDLVQLIGSHGIYAQDPVRSGRSLEQLIAIAKIDAAAAHQPIDQAEVQRELDLLRASLPNEEAWEALLARAGTNPSRLRAEVAENIRARAWLEERIAAAKPASDDEIRGYFAAHLAEFEQPPRYRASHLFLAAPDGYPAEVLETKERMINELALRLQQGEAFEALVAEFSEDEGTKKHGGDPGYFSAERMLPEVFVVAQNLKIGETSAPIRSRLGYHLLRLTEALPAREMTLEEAAPEIAAKLANAQRAATLAQFQ